MIEATLALGAALIEASSGKIGIYRGIPIAYGQSSPELPRSRQRENQGRSLDPQKKPQENSYRIFYSLKYIPYTHSTCRIYSLLVPGILESRMSQETASYSFDSGPSKAFRHRCRSE